MNDHRLLHRWLLFDHSLELTWDCMRTQPQVNWQQPLVSLSKDLSEKNGQNAFFFNVFSDNQPLVMISCSSLMVWFKSIGMVWHDTNFLLSLSNEKSLSSATIGISSAPRLTLPTHGMGSSLKAISCTDLDKQFHKPPKYRSLKLCRPISD